MGHRDEPAAALRRAELHTGRGRDKGGRPRGELREALAAAAAWWQQQRQMAPLRGTQGEELVGATWPELRQRACLARGVGVVVLKNMVRAGELARVGKVPVAGYPRPLGVYAPARRSVAPQTLDDVQRALVAMVRRAVEEHAEAPTE